MRSWLLSGMIALIATPYLAQADTDPCLHALDDKGCKEFHSGQTAYKLRQC